ncbi:MAG: peptidase S1, partial [Edaphobacter sp.]
MKLRPVLLVIFLLSGFYYLTTHLAPTGTFAPWVHRVFTGPTVPNATPATASGPMGTLELTQAAAAPAFDAEEQ